jgi:hypothetical protein
VGDFLAGFPGKLVPSSRLEARLKHLENEKALQEEK